MAISIAKAVKPAFIRAGRACKARCEKYVRLCLTGAVSCVVFAVFMLLLRREMMLNIALTVLFIFFMFALVYGYGRKISSREELAEEDGDPEK